MHIAVYVVHGSMTLYYIFIFMLGENYLPHMKDHVYAPASNRK